MKKNFFRKVAFGLSPNEKINEDPLNWAKQQFDTDFEKLMNKTTPFDLKTQYSKGGKKRRFRLIKNKNKNHRLKY